MTASPKMRGGVIGMEPDIKIGNRSSRLELMYSQMGPK